MPPGVDGGDGYAEVVGEVLDGEESVEGVHSRSVREDPVIRMPGTLSWTLSGTLQLKAVGALLIGYPVIVGASGKPCAMGLGRLVRHSGDRVFDTLVGEGRVA